MKYEVRSYKTEKDFDERKPSSIVDGFRKDGAMAFGVLQTREFAIVKIQSEDREEIWIIKKHS